jgi:hypothetical protein
VTSIYVVVDRCPVLYVSNDDDEEGGSTWQFHCGNGDFSMDKILLVKLDIILNLDKELADLELELEVGEEAVRSTVDSEWMIRSQDLDDKSNKG